jgi:hypothetical protein
MTRLVRGIHPLRITQNFNITFRPGLPEKYDNSRWVGQLINSGTFIELSPPDANRIENQTIHHSQTTNLRFVTPTPQNHGVRTR